MSPFIEASFFSYIIYAGKQLYTFYPIWLPLLLGVIFFDVWMDFVRSDYIKKQGSVLLQVKLPKEITKSPAAMEVIFTALYQTGTATYIETYWLGKVRPWYSLEMVSTEGKVHFYIWTWAKWENIIQAQIYAQYPTVEIYEVPDYMSWFEHDNPEYAMWGTYFGQTNKKGDAYPIKTYVDYGLDRADMKEEFKLDPMTSVLEYLGSLGPGEHTWIQILFQASKKEWVKQGRLFPQPEWKEKVKKEIKKLRDELKVNPEDPESRPRFPTKGETDVISALERSAHKIPFEVAIRGMTIGKKAEYNKNLAIAGLIGSFRQYNSNELNGFRLGWFTDFDYPWEDFKRIRRTRAEKQMVEAFKLRSFFNPPYKYFKQRPYVFTTEALATVFHFPGDVAQTPTLDRIPSKKSQAPSNLPV